MSPITPAVEAGNSKIPESLVEAVREAANSLPVPEPVVVSKKDMQALKALAPVLILAFTATFNLLDDVIRVANEVVDGGCLPSVGFVLFGAGMVWGRIRVQEFFQKYQDPIPPVEKRISLKIERERKQF
mgnify:FL=1